MDGWREDGACAKRLVDREKEDGGWVKTFMDGVRGCEANVEPPPMVFNSNVKEGKVAG